MPNVANAIASAVVWIEANKVAGSMITAAVALLLFAATRLLERLVRLSERVALRRRLVIGLHAEIGSNVKEIEEFTDNIAFFKAVKERVRQHVPGEPVFRPLIVITESSRFFLASAGSIPELKTEALVPLMEFYRLIEELSDRRDAFETQAYALISSGGRAGTVDDLWLTGTKAKLVGLHAQKKFLELYPRKWFAKLERAQSEMPTAPTLPDVLK